MHAIRRRITFANVISLIALFVALGGTSYAAVQLTGANIRNGTITSVDIANGKLGVTGVDVKDGSLTSADLSSATKRALRGQTGATGPQGPAGASGAPGATGATGSTGARGISAWDTIPSGTTVTGTYSMYTSSSDTASNIYRIAVDLPAKAPIALTAANVNFAGLADGTYTDATTTCTGTNVAPTAPAGNVCIYTGTYAGFNTIVGSSLVLGPSTQAFEIQLTRTSATPGEFVYALGTWAYTAP